MAERFHCNSDGVWEEDVRDWDSDEWKKNARSFTADDVVKVEADKEFVVVRLKDGSEIVPDYTQHGSHEQAVEQANIWREAIFGEEEAQKRKPWKNKAIQTEYKGYIFRSRREARWAVFLDSCRAKWEYEIEGFELEGGIKYLPDFLVHDVPLIHGMCSDQTIENAEIVDLWIEVKTDVPTELDKKKVELFSVDHSIIVVAGIPDGNDIRSLTDTMCWDDAVKNGLDFYNFVYIDGDNFPAYPGITTEGGFGLFGADGHYLCYCDEHRTIDAYKAARQARFEYGERPKIANRF